MLGVLIIALGVHGCRQPEGRIAEKPSQKKLANVTPARVEVVTLSLPPVSTFEDACARCHGPQGSFYGEEFARLKGEKLADVVREMMVGPASLQPSDTDVRAMTAYHHALAAQEPFLAGTAYELSSETATGRIQGEASPDAVISVTGGESRQTRAGAEGGWEIKDLPQPLPPVLTAEKAGKTTRLDLRQSQWSHTRPEDAPRTLNHAARLLSAQGLTAASIP